MEPRRSCDAGWAISSEAVRAGARQVGQPVLSAAGPVVDMRQGEVESTPSTATPRALTIYAANVGGRSNYGNSGTYAQRIFKL